MALLDLMGLGADKQAVVIDIGMAFTKIGLAGEHVPRHIIQTELKKIIDGQLVSVPILRRSLSESDEKETLYSLFKDFFHEIYFKHLLVNPKERRVIICDSMLKPIHIRNLIAEVLYKYFEVVSTVFIPNHLLALFTCGLQTGIVVDVGFAETVVVPIFEQSTILNGLEFIDLAAFTMHEHINDQVIKCGTVVINNQEKPAKDHIKQLEGHVLEDIKVRCCFVGRRQCDKEAIPVKYPLEGGITLNVDGKLRAHAADLLFEGDDEGKSIATLILDSIKKCPIDCRKQLAENIVLTGGSVMMPGFESRLMAELKHLLQTEQYKSSLFLKKLAFKKSPVPANYCAWQGGALLGALEILPELSMSRDRYNADPFIPDWSTVLAIDKEDVSKSLLDDDYKWKKFKKNLPTASPASAASGSSSLTRVPLSSTDPLSTAGTSSISTTGAQTTLSVSERLRKELGLTK